MDYEKKQFQSGFVSIIGKPNVGKSTLLNQLLKEKLSIVTPKVQTTRHKILGILSENNYQIIFTDTPGLIVPKYLLQKTMMNASYKSLKGTDVVLWVVDINDKEIDNSIIQKDIPLILIVNKIDLYKNEKKIKELLEYWKHQVPIANIVPISAKEDFNLEKIINIILEYLPHHEPYYSKNLISDRSIIFFISEIIRENIFFYLEQEVPYSSEVKIEKFDKIDDKVVIKAIIYVERESQKGIMIGKGGDMLKKIGFTSRKGISKFLDTNVYLDLFVKVLPNWRKNSSSLKNFGYE